MSKIKKTKLLSIGAICFAATLCGVGFTKTLQDLDLMKQTTDLELVIGSIGTFLISSGTYLYFSAKNAHRTKEDMNKCAVKNSKLLEIGAISAGGTAFGLMLVKGLQHMDIIMPTTTHELTMLALKSVFISGCVQLYFANKDAEKAGKKEIEEPNLVKNNVTLKM